MNAGEDQLTANQLELLILLLRCLFYAIQAITFALLIYVVMKKSPKEMSVYRW